MTERLASRSPTWMLIGVLQLGLLAFGGHYSQNMLPPLETYLETRLHISPVGYGTLLSAAALPVFVVSIFNSMALEVFGYSRGFLTLLTLVFVAQFFFIFSVEFAESLFLACLARILFSVGKSGIAIAQRASIAVNFTMVCSKKQSFESQLLARLTECSSSMASSPLSRASYFGRVIFPEDDIEDITRCGDCDRACSLLEFDNEKTDLNEVQIVAGPMMCLATSLVIGMSNLAQMMAKALTIPLLEIDIFYVYFVSILLCLISSLTAVFLNIKDIGQIDEVRGVNFIYDIIQSALQYPKTFWTLNLYYVEVVGMNHLFGNVSVAYLESENNSPVLSGYLSSLQHVFSLFLTPLLSLLLSQGHRDENICCAVKTRNRVLKLLVTCSVAFLLAYTLLSYSQIIPGLLVLSFASSTAPVLANTLIPDAFEGNIMHMAFAFGITELSTGFGLFFGNILIGKLRNLFGFSSVLYFLQALAVVNLWHGLKLLRALEGG